MSDSEFPPCPECSSEYTYENGHILACPDCGHEWAPVTPEASGETAPADDETVRDTNGNELVSGDDVKLIKDLKVGGTSSSITKGTKVKNIRILTGDRVSDGHNIDCKIDGVGAIKLKSAFVKKA
jgi:protein PhnA